MSPNISAFKIPMNYSKINKNSSENLSELNSKLKSEKFLMNFSQISE